MEIVLIRKFFNDNYTIGKLSIDGVYFCDTLEDKVRDLQDINHDEDFDDEGEGKIYGQTAIPYGLYQVEIVFWKKHQKDIPILSGVEGFTGILIHAGASQKDTEGCILVGENRIKGRLVNSPCYSTTLTKKIKEAIEAKEKVFITIKQ